ncbi:MAG TPA: peptidylprolyl isomerase [Acidobacteriota bacterium]|nr:peptidylprolyl isomerase [Acidobacteriota bacterium]
MTRSYLMCVLLFVAVSCVAAPAQQQTPAAPTPAPQAATAGSDLVVLRVNGEPITENQVVVQVGLLARQKQLPSNSQEDRNVTLFKGAVDNIVIETLLHKEAIRLNLAPDQAKVEEQWQTILKQFPSQEEFQKALAAQGYTDAKLRKEMEESSKIEQVLDQAVKGTPLATDADVQKFYDDNSPKFMRKEQVHAAHILLLVDKNSTPEQKAAIKKKLEEIRSEIDSKKITFSDAAAKYSQDSGSAKQGGDLGYFTRGQMVPPFEEAAFAAEPGSLSQVVETQYGFHLINVIDKKPAGKAPFEEVKGDIKRLLDQTSLRKVTQQYVNDLKTKAMIENFMTPEEFIRRHMAGR